jgi:hypothetical protein
MRSKQTPLFEIVRDPPPLSEIEEPPCWLGLAGAVTVSCVAWFGAAAIVLRYCR